MKPAFAAMAILNGMNAWNNYLWPLLVIRSSEKYTLTLGLNTLINLTEIIQPAGSGFLLLHCADLHPVRMLPEVFHRRYDSRRCKRVTRESNKFTGLPYKCYNYPIVHDLF